ncbi:MAG TPA: hypothetical protein VM901_10905 [Bdellovibrionota bacterium]|jgi:hypothetical protein|nr:hypothetical protein [Bdellovibrionota bacterium]
MKSVYLFLSLALVPQAFALRSETRSLDLIPAPQCQGLRAVEVSFDDAKSNGIKSFALAMESENIEMSFAGGGRAGNGDPKNYKLMYSSYRNQKRGLSATLYGDDESRLFNKVEVVHWTDVGSIDESVEILCEYTLAKKIPFKKWWPN